MLGNIIGFENDNVLIKLAVDLSKFSNLMNLYIIMEDEEDKFIGEIIDIKGDILYANMLGEIKNDAFVTGIIRKPSFTSSVKLVSKEKIPLIVSLMDYKENRDLYIGSSPIYKDVKIGVNINDFFSNHFAIFGSTGSGKSCSVARIFQNLFKKKTSIAYKSNIFLFDAYGEYHAAFQDLSKEVPEITFKYYTTNTKMQNILKIPLWLLDTDDICLLLNVEKHSQIPIIEKALKLVSVFARDEKVVLKHKNDIIARAILDILASGRPSVQIRDQVFAILSHYNTSELNLESQIFQPGYTRPVKHCLIIDSTGKLREMELLINYFESFTSSNLKLEMPDGTFKYNLSDLEDAFEFALISEGILKSDKVFDEVNSLRVRLHSLVNSDYARFFQFDSYISKDKYIKKLLFTDDNRKAQIINFNINYVDDRFAKTITKIYSKLLFNYSKHLERRATLPFHIVLEEAHRYVQRDTDNDILGYNIFERITKEGRKYGVILGLISQRPSELSETTLSQCSNFLIFKMLHPLDINYIKEMVPNITKDIVSKIKVLQPGSCMAFGNAFKVPTLIKFDMPDPMPSSSNCNVSGIWFVNKK